jgi:hypothetical protein
VKGLLQDPSPGASWILEPYVVGEVDYNGASVIVEGTFRHKKCTRVSTSGTPFPELTCSLCTIVIVGAICFMEEGLMAKADCALVHF